MWAAVEATGQQWVVGFEGRKNRYTERAWCGRWSLIMVMGLLGVDTAKDEKVETRE